MEQGTGYKWSGKEYAARLRKHNNRNLDRAAIFLASDIRNSFGNSGITGTSSGATQSDRAGNRSKPWGSPNVDTGHLKRSIGFERHGRLRRKVGTGIGGKESVGYAMWLEFGTRHMLPRPFLRPAILRNRKKLLKILTRKFR